MPHNQEGVVQCTSETDQADKALSFPIVKDGRMNLMITERTKHYSTITKTKNS